MPSYTRSLSPDDAAHLAARVEKAARRYHKAYPDHGAVTVEVGKQYLEMHEGQPRARRDAVVTWELPQHGDAEFCGVLSCVYSDEDGTSKTLTIYRGATLDEDPRRGALDPHGALVCDACGMSRRRSECYVLRRRDGSLYRVGGDCLAREQVGFGAAFVRLLEEVQGAYSDPYGEEQGAGPGRATSGYYARTFVAHVVRSIRLAGWVSRKQAYDTGYESTCSAAMKAIVRNVKVEEADHKRAKTILDWAATLDVEEPGFRGALAVLGRCSFWPDDVLGVGAAIVGAYDRSYYERLRPAAAGPYTPTPKTKGKRTPLAIEGTFVAHVVLARRASFVGAYGPTVLLTFRDLNTGHDLVWSTSELGAEIGDMGHLEGKIKGADEYRGVYQVRVTRCTWTRENSPCQELSE
jgi:hypothetical protein